MQECVLITDSLSALGFCKMGTGRHGHSTGFYGSLTEIHKCCDCNFDVIIHHFKT